MDIKNPAKPEEKATSVRFEFPADVKKKIKTHQRKVSAATDTDATFEQAVIDFIRKAKL